jgi:hypothetical protein
MKLRKSSRLKNLAKTKFFKRTIRYRLINYRLINYSCKLKTSSLKNLAKAKFF